MDTFLQDLRFTLRTYRHDLGFTVVAVLILGLGIGANTTVFTVVNSILFRPLPFADQERLVWIYNHDRDEGLSRIDPMVALRTT